MDIKTYIREIKEFYQVRDFRSEILDFSFGNFEDHQGLVFHLGHPPESHKGNGIGDTLAYSKLPTLIKQRRPDAYITLPVRFKDFYKMHPDISAYQDKYQKWGSLGTWGTTFQRACNVWNIKNLDPFPVIHLSKSEQVMIDLYKKSKIPLVVISTSSVSGQEISKKGLKTIQEAVEDFYEGHVKIEQIGLTGDPVLGGVAQYHFDVPNMRHLVNIIAKSDWYIGPHNGLSHIAKATGVRSVIILTQNIPAEIIYLPFLTQINELETNMLSEKDVERKYRFIGECQRTGIDLTMSGELGWLYPDNQHISDSNEGTERCPKLDYDNLFSALAEQNYPFGKEELWNIEKYQDLWCGGPVEVQPEKPRIEVKSNLYTIGIQILSYNRPEHVFKTVDSLIERNKEDVGWRYEVTVLEQSDQEGMQEQIKIGFVSDKYRSCGMPFRLVTSSQNLGQRGGTNFLYMNNAFEKCDFWMNTDHDNIFHEPLSIYCDILNKYPDCYIATGYHSPEHDTKRIIVDDIFGTILIKSTARFGHHVMRVGDIRKMLPADEKCSCGGAAWFCGMDWWISHWSPVAPGRTERNNIGFVYCVPGGVEHIGIDKSTWLGDKFKHPEYSQEDHNWIRQQVELERILEKFPNRNVY